MTTLYQTPHVLISLHEEATPTLEISWQGFTPSADLREVMQHALSLVAKLGVHAWLSDDTLLGAVRPRDLEWAEDALFLALGSLGLERFALVESPDPVNRMVINAMYERITPRLPYPVRRFDDLAAARAWVTSMAA